MKCVTKDKEGKILSIEEYDNNGNLIYYKDSDGFESFYKYNDNRDLIWHKGYEPGYEEWYDYDEQYRLIHYHDIEGLHHIFEYDDNGNLIHEMSYHEESEERFEQIFGMKPFNKYHIYDDKNRIISTKNMIDDSEYFYEYED